MPFSCCSVLVALTLNQSGVKMIKNTLIFSFLLIGLVAGQINEFISKHLAEKRSDEHLCPDIAGNYFIPNTRGCAWYHVCIDGVNRGQQRCPAPFWFNYEEQQCDHRYNVDCDLDDRWVNVNCPPGPGIFLIPHPHSCSKYTG